MLNGIAAKFIRKIEKCIKMTIHYNLYNLYNLIFFSCLLTLFSHIFARITTACPSFVSENTDVLKYKYQ